MTHTSLRDHFLLDPTVTFLNHGSFGACPRPVFETYQRWQLELERQPVEFLGRRHDALLAEARAALATYVGADADDLLFVPNATIGINIAAHSLQLAPGDEILSTDHEYGAMDYTWQAICQKAGAAYIRHPLPLPLDDAESVAESLWSAVTPRTRAIFLSHITSPTALILPVADIAKRAREAGILTIVDGAHAPGQLPLNLDALGVDIYTGNCHKWLCAPKGAGFLYVRREHHGWIEPLITSWGWPQADFVTRNQWQGTRDIAAFLSVPDAIRFQADHDWDSVRARCHDLAVQTRARVAELTGIPPTSAEAAFAQMVALPVPLGDVFDLKARLYDAYRIEIPAVIWNDRPLLRVSFQGYNTVDDADRLVAALGDLLPER